MKTKEELVLDFMLALASNSYITEGAYNLLGRDWPQVVREGAEKLTWEYLDWKNGEKK